MLSIDELRNLCAYKNLAITKHAVVKLKERSITVTDLKCAIATGEILRQYEDDKPFPSCLVLGKDENDEYIHVVASIDGDFLHIITAYRPDVLIWEEGFKEKRRK